MGERLDVKGTFFADEFLRGIGESVDGRACYTYSVV